MTGVEWILLLIGSIFMIGSFFVTEKLSPSELNKIAELSEDELKKIIERGLGNAKNRIEEAIDDQLEASMDKVDRALEKETNDKIMAISDYSDTVLEGMNKTHNEIMFLYSMLNDKHAELTGMVSDIQRMAADIRNLEENFQMQEMVETPVVAQTQTPAMQVASVSVPVAQDNLEDQISVDEVAVQEESKQESVRPAQREGIQREILALHNEGLTDVQIARNLGMGIGEVRLIIGLYRGE